MGWRDIGAHISLVKQGIAQEADMLPDQTAELVVVGGSRVPMPL